MSVSGGSKFTILGDPLSGLLIFWDLTRIIELTTPNFSSFGASTLSNLQTQARKCAKLTDLAGRWVSGWGFIWFQFRQFVKVLDSQGQGMVRFLSPKLYFWPHYLVYFSHDAEIQFKTASIFVKFHLLGKFGWKLDLLHFFNDFWVLFITSTRC